MNIDIVIPTLRSREELRQQITDIKKTTLIDPYVSGLKASASANRNNCFKNTKGDIVIQIDDDVTNFYPGWHIELIQPLENKDVLAVQGFLLNKDGSDQWNVSMTMDKKQDYPRIARNRFCTAVFAVRREDINALIDSKEFPLNAPYDENFKGSGHEDLDFSGCLYKLFKCRRYYVVNNKCRLVHINEQKNQHGEYWDHNKAYIIKKSGSVEG